MRTLYCTDLYGSNRAGGVTENSGYNVATEPKLGVMLANLGNARIIYFSIFLTRIHIWILALWNNADLPQLVDVCACQYSFLSSHFATVAPSKSLGPKLPVRIPQDLNTR
jgi:hypothetical protein